MITQINTYLYAVINAINHRTGRRLYIGMLTSEGQGRSDGWEVKRKCILGRRNSMNEEQVTGEGA